MKGQDEDKASVKAYFAAEADRFDAIYDASNSSPLQTFVDRSFRTRVLRKRNEAIAGMVKREASCFEIGCGSGRTSVAIAAARSARVHGVDIAAPMIDIADKHAAEAGLASLCTFEAADFEDVEPEATYDTFVAVGVLDYFADPLPMLQRAATEFVPGGAIVLTWPGRRMLLNLARRAWLATKKCPVYFYTDADIERYASALGGRVTDTVHIGIAPLNMDGIARIEL